jgi:ribosomal protein S18 acetylase RimI-like enzyme
VSFQPVADNLRESFRIVAASRAGGEVRELAGVSVASASATFQMFNAAFLAAPVASEAELNQRILLAMIHFQSRNLEWAYWLCEDFLDARSRRRAWRVFEKYGLRLSVQLPGMITDAVLPPDRPLPPLEVRRVEPGPPRDAFCAIGSTCFHVPIAWFKEVFDGETVWERFAGYVGYVNGEPVSTTAIIHSDGVLGVYNVATLPAYQRHGYGEALMRQALADAQQRHFTKRVVLQSTPVGLTLYQRMGFQTVTKVSVSAS